MGGRGDIPGRKALGTGGLRFEWDANKSASNEIKHGISSEKAVELWEDVDRIVVDSLQIGEPRGLTTGLIDGKMYTAVTTDRSGVIRIISVRRARDKEVRSYVE